MWYFGSTTTREKVKEFFFGFLFFRLFFQSSIQLILVCNGDVRSRCSRLRRVRFSIKKIPFSIHSKYTFASNYDGSVCWIGSVGLSFLELTFYDIFVRYSTSPASEWNTYRDIVSLMGELLLTSWRWKSDIVAIIEVGKDICQKIYQLRRGRTKKTGLRYALSVLLSRWQWI